MTSVAHKIAAAPAALPPLPDEILEDIFLRLDAAADLVRASAACTTFRRLVSSRRFLRRFRSLHAPPVLGFLEYDARGEFHPAEAPHPSAPAARALAQAADFTFSFLGIPNCWQVCDARDGRVLLYRRVRVTSVFADLVVCDPLHRRYVQLPPILDDLSAATGGWGMQEFEPFLDPVSKEENEEEDFCSFRVICAVHCKHKLVTFHYSSGTGKWREVTLNRSTPLTASLEKFPGLFERHYVHGSFYWTISVIQSFMFMLDIHEMKIRVVDLPRNRGRHWSWGPHSNAVVEVGEGRVGLFVFCDGMLELYSKALQNNGVGTEEWQCDKIMPLPEKDCYWSAYATAGGYLLLQSTAFDTSSQFVGRWPEMRESQYFTLDLKTLLIEKLCVSNQQYSRGANLYASFPPPLSRPSI